MLLYVFEKCLYVYVDFIFGAIVGYAQPKNFNLCFRNYFVNLSVFEKKHIRYEMCIWGPLKPSSQTSFGKNIERYYYKSTWTLI